MKFNKNQNDQERVQAIYDLALRSGSFFSCGYERELTKELTKEWKGKVAVTKRTESVYRTDIQYSHTKAFIAKDREVQALPKSQGTDNLLQWTYDDDGNIVAFKIRLYTVDGQKSNVTYYLDGEPISKQELINRGILKDTQHKGEAPIMFTVFVKDLLYIGQGA